MGEDFTAKDFRTWGATLHAAAVLGGTPAPRGENKRACTTHINKVIESVAETLCNTPAVCRKSYINPVIFELWRSGGLQQIPVARAGRTSRRVEQAVARILRRHGRSSARRRSEEHTSELQSLMRNSYAVLCLKTQIPTLYCTEYPTIEKIR